MLKLPLHTMADVETRLGMRGTVKYWNEQRGFGFITPDDGRADIFVHMTSLRDGLGELVQGQRVEFDEGVSHRSTGKPEAKNVKVLQ